jgi:hypothetical protein
MAFSLKTGGLKYLTSNVNSFFLVKSQFMRSSEGTKERLPIKNDEESSLVAGNIEISNLLEHFYMVVDLSDYITDNA